MFRRRPSSGFTLLELILVLLIISIALAMAAPSLRGWSHGSQLRDAGDQFLTVARWARAQAASEASIHRLNVDADKGTYQVTVQQGDQFVNITSTFGQVYSVPDGFHIEMTDLDGKAVQSADFYPSGRVTPAHVKIVGPEETGAVDIESPTPVEGFGYVNPQGHS